MPKILPPKPLERPPDPATLLRLCRVKGAGWAPGIRQRCPLCHGAPRDAERDERRREDTLDVTVNLHNEMVIRCHLCGFAGTALALLRRTAQPPWEEIPGILERAGVFGGEPVPDGWVERSRVWEEFANLFAQAEACYRIRVRAGKHVHPQFGEVGLAAGTDLDAILPGLRLGKKWGKGVYHVEVRRSLSGLPLAAVIIQMKTGREVARHWFQPPEPLEVLAPEWAIHTDWSGPATVCTDLSKVGEIQKELAVGGKPPSEPLIWVAGCAGEILDDVPMREVRYVPGDGEPGDFALAFARRNTVVRIGGRDAVAVVAEEIASGGGDPARHLDGVLAKPWVSEEAARRLTRAVADRIGEPLESLLGRSGLCGNVLPCRVSRFTYLARGGIILKRCGKGNWSPCSNFSIRLEESAVDGGGVTYRLRLFLGGGSIPFEAMDEKFADGKRLMRLATSAAVGAGLGLPNMPEARDVSRLPAIVRETSVPTMVPAPVEMGFAGDRFHRANFTVSPSGIRFGKGAVSANLLPEPMLFSEADHLALKANELGTWLGGLGGADRTAAGAVIHAALGWLHRASRNLDSFLLVPSREHLDLLGSLLGIVPVEVGRSREDRGVPRLMASLYSARCQFQKQGEIVAAVGDKGRRADPSVPTVVHAFGAAIPNPPSSYLGLFSYSCLGTRDPGEAATKMSCLTEDPVAASAIRMTVDLGRRFYVPPDGYLDVFLTAVKRHFGSREMEIESRGRKLLRREAVRGLRRFGYDFSETRIIGELRERTGLDQPARFGRGRVPVFVVSYGERPEKGGRWDQEDPRIRARMPPLMEPGADRNLRGYGQAILIRLLERRAFSR